MRFSIVTPSYNQADFLDDAIRSVLNQSHPDVEYIVMDGGSTDGTVEIIRKYEDALTSWRSRRDEGQYDAIQAGFERCSGEIMGWLNSDDMYAPWAFEIVAEVFDTFSSLEWITTANQLTWDRKGRAIRCTYKPWYTRESFLAGFHLPRVSDIGYGPIQQESTFWRRSLWDRAGGQLETSLQYAGDFELWARFFQHARLYALETPLGGFRRHGNQKTSRARERYLAEARAVLAHAGGEPSPSRLSWAIHRGLRRLPRSLTDRASLLESARVCRYSDDEGRWVIIGI